MKSCISTCYIQSALKVKPSCPFRDFYKRWTDSLYRSCQDRIRIFSLRCVLSVWVHWGREGYKSKKSIKPRFLLKKSSVWHSRERFCSKQVINVIHCFSFGSFCYLSCNKDILLTNIYGLVETAALFIDTGQGSDISCHLYCLVGKTQQKKIRVL